MASSKPRSHIFDIFSLFPKHSANFVEGPALTFLTFLTTNLIIYVAKNPWNYGQKCPSIAIGETSLRLQCEASIKILSSRCRDNAINKRKEKKVWKTLI